MDLLRQPNLLVEENCSLLEGGDPPCPITEDEEMLGGELDSECRVSVLFHTKAGLAMLALLEG